MSDLSKLSFTSSRPLTLGVELELQLVSLRGLRPDPCRHRPAGRFAVRRPLRRNKTEITESMIEVNSRPRQDVTAIAVDLDGLREVLVSHCQRNNIATRGGGTHPFHHWPERRICPGERFAFLNQRYGYLS